MKKLWNIAIVGATGAVGAQMIECLEERSFPVGKMKFLSAGKAAGEYVDFGGGTLQVEELREGAFEGVDIAFFCGRSSHADEFCPAAARAGAVCIDSSGTFRLDKDVPLVVPEVNSHAIAGYTKKGIIANPGCSTIQMVVALKPLHDFGQIKRIVLSTYAAVSSTGNKAIAELRAQSGQLLNGKPAKIGVYPHRIAFNCLPQVDSFCDNGYTKEEMNIAQETAKIMESDIKTTATAVQVPVFFGHSESINVETRQKVSAEKARELLRDAPGVELVDEDDYPMAMNAAGQDMTLVGRIREDDTIDNGLNLWVVADNLRKGAATNAVQIAEILIQKYLK